jgi:hypothetical protein
MASLSVNEQLATLIYAETHALHKEDPKKLRTLRNEIAHALINSLVAGLLPHLRKTQGVDARSQQEKDTYKACLSAVETAQKERARNIDPTSGGTNYVIQKNDMGNFELFFYK